MVTWGVTPASGRAACSVTSSRLRSMPCTNGRNPSLLVASISVGACRGLTSTRSGRLRVRRSSSKKSSVLSPGSMGPVDRVATVASPSTRRTGAARDTLPLLATVTATPAGRSIASTRRNPTSSSSVPSGGASATFSSIVLLLSSRSISRMEASGSTDAVSRCGPGRSLDQRNSTTDSSRGPMSIDFSSTIPAASRNSTVSPCTDRREWFATTTRTRISSPGVGKGCDGTTETTAMLSASCGRRIGSWASTDVSAQMSVKAVAVRAPRRRTDRIGGFTAPPCRKRTAESDGPYD